MAAGHSKTLKFLSGIRNALNIVTVINGVFILVYVNNALYLNEIFKKRTHCCK
jgi:hypothetical protein